MSDAGPPGGGIRAALRRAQQEPTGFLAAVVVFVVCAVVSLIAWLPLSLPGRFIAGLIPQARCVGLTPGSPPMYVCSAWVGALAVVGPLILVAVLFVLRRPLARAVARVRERIPEEGRFLAAPITATLVFVIAWAGMHYQTADQSGLVPQTVFPAVVGLFTFAVQRWGPALQRALVPIFDLRDRYPIGIRLLAAIGIPLVVSLVITFEQRVTATAMKEQVVALLALVTGYIALAPRSGAMLAGIERTLRGIGKK